MKYTTMYRPYHIPTIVGLAKGEKGTWQETKELEDWNKALNKKASEGYKVISSGVAVSGDTAMFWAMFESFT